MEKGILRLRNFISSIVTLCLFLILSTPSTASTTSCVAPPSSLVGWWPGDDNANDIAGTNNGSFNGIFIPGEVEEAFNISGTGIDYVTVPSSAALQPQNITVDAWVKANGSPGDFKYIIDKGASSIDCAGNASYALYTGESGGLFFYISDGTTVVESPDAGTGVWDNQWHFVAGTYDGASVSLYVDGNLVGSNPASLTINYGFPDNTLYFGNYPDCTTQNLSFDGGIDEVEIFSRALLQSEIQAIFNAGSSGKCKNSPPTLVKRFSPNVICDCQTSTLTISLTNPNDVNAILTSPLVDLLPSGIKAIASSATNTCGGVVSVVNHNTTVKLTGAFISAGASCVVRVRVKGEKTGRFINTLPSGALQTNLGSNLVPAVAVLKVSR
ncbi:MAG TPA: LamG domain-containing protein [Myxococcota bacterium]|nr:LamG domain-containing protein [Myxococcota bacterium]